MALPRRLHFVVGTSLLGASLTLGCTAKPKEPEAKEPINVRPEPEAPPAEAPQPPQPVLDGPHINEGPKPEPPPPEIIKVNPGPEPETAPEPEKAPEPVGPKGVNTRPTDI
jgi:hypothetical protein